MESLPLPKTLTQTTERGHRATFTIEPLYPGYGMTVGNALRRVLLSSLPGAAITAVQFEGATHEFSTLPYVKEDVVDILLNLKQVRLKFHGDEPTTVKIEVTGEHVVTAGDITGNSQVEVVNPKQHIATLTDKAGKLTMELTVGTGRGYVPVENREKERMPLGTIALDAIYTPIKTVNFTTENVRVGQMTNYDKLILDVTTDGTVEPTDAVEQATKILVDHFQFVLSNTNGSAVAEETDDVEEGTEDVDEPKKKAKKKKSEETDSEGKE
jgi:DNA-directed RNA polymerase subunit alpha